LAIILAICGTVSAADQARFGGKVAKQTTNTVISGNVIQCSNGEQFSGVTIKVSKRNKVIATTTTNKHGYYSVSTSSNQRMFKVTASYPGHGSITKDVKSTTINGQKTVKANFRLGPRNATCNGLKTGYYKSIYIRDYYGGYYSAGTIRVTIDGESFDAYCIDLFTDISTGDVLLVNGALIASGTGNLPSGVNWSKVNYILNQFNANGNINGSTNRANNGAAIQAAIWHFTTAQYGKYPGTGGKYQFMTDPMTRNYDARLISGSASTVRNIAQYIINQANANNFKYPVKITLNPESATLYNGNTQKIIATVYDQNNSPLSGINVSFSTDRGSLSSTSGTTNAQGQITVNLTTNGLNSGVANILAWAAGKYGTLLYYDPAGEKLQDLATTTTVPYSIQATSTITFAKKADVNMTKTASNTTPKVGQQFYYTITLRNTGPDSATNVKVTDNLPSGLTFNRYTATQGTYNNGLWTVGTLARNAVATLTLYVTPTISTAGQTITNAATETQTEYDPTPAKANATIQVGKAVNLFNNGFYASSCNSIIWRVYIENTANESLYDLTINDFIAPESGTAYWMEYVSYDSGYTWEGDGYDPKTGNWTLKELPAGATYVLAVYAIPKTGPGTYHNSATYGDQKTTASIEIA